MAKKIEIILPQGALGSSSSDDMMTRMLRDIAVKYSKDPDGEWAEKYGTRCRDEKFIMHPYCWCERENDCPYCYDLYDANTDGERETKEEHRTEFGSEADSTAPNFWYKPLGLKVWWYKYIGRGMQANKTISYSDFLKMSNELTAAPKQGQP